MKFQPQKIEKKRRGKQSAIYLQELHPVVERVAKKHGLKVTTLVRQMVEHCLKEIGELNEQAD